ncbi:MAG: replicative DNA helicase [Bacilli bacterium]|nr:replicative DNA helicase [Bacilli bacterium]MBN2877831.1 replicative DNA helicase [Bacilli bacterium]
MDQIPANIEAEQAVLGTIFFENYMMKTITDKLNESDFYYPNHKIIYRVMKDLFAQEISIDYVTVVNHLESMNQLSKAGGVEYITQLANTVPSTSNFLHYINIVKDKAVLRKLQDTINQILEESKSVSNTPEFIDDVEKNILNVTKERRASDFVDVSIVAHRTLENIAVQAQHTSDVTGLDTKYHELNKVTLGLQPSDLIIIAARPSVGKTAFALNLALNVGKLKRKPNIAFFSLEMGVDQLVMRLLSCQAQVDNTSMRKGSLNSQDWEKLQHAAKILEDTNIYFDDSGTVRVTELRSKCRKLKQEDKLDLIIIDYLQLLSGSPENRGNRVQEVSEISRVLKEMARELKVPVIALSQLSRNLERRENKRPMMADLRESGSIEQDADIIVFLYNPGDAEQDESKRNQVEFIVAKNRSGITSNFELLFNKNMSNFNNLRTAE